MKKAFRIVFVLALAVLCLTAVAAAADAPASGICDMTSKNAAVTLEAQKADGTAVTTTTTQGDKEVYADAVKVELTYTGDSVDTDAQYLVLVLNSSGEQVIPDKDNVAFIDQAKGTVTFTIYPETLENGKTYEIYLTTSSSTDTTVGATKEKMVGSFSYYAAYKLGDVNQDTFINVTDVQAVIDHITGTKPLTGNGLLAANVAGNDDTVNVTDVQAIIDHITGARPLA